MSDEDLRVEIERLRTEIEAVKQSKPAEDLRVEVIKHLSAEITAHIEFLTTLRSRMGFTVLVGPFLVLGSVLIATKSVPASLAWPTRDQWHLLILAIFCYLLLGIYAGGGQEYNESMQRLAARSVIGR